MVRILIRKKLWLEKENDTLVPITRSVASTSFSITARFCDLQLDHSSFAQEGTENLRDMHLRLQSTLESGGNRNTMDLMIMVPRVSQSLVISPETRPNTRITQPCPSTPPILPPGWTRPPKTFRMFQRSYLFIAWC